MKKPAMILFDYGQTLGNETVFNGVAGTRAVMQHTVRNPHGYTAEDVQAHAEAINHELGRFDPVARLKNIIEIPNHMFTSYLYQSMGIELSLTPAQIDRIFWDAAAPAVPTDGIAELLSNLHAQGIRTGVISNITYDGAIVAERIRSLLPEHHFEFIIATSDYMFRKPDSRIFTLALEKAGLAPDDVWYIGDQYGFDVLGARGAGLFPVWYIGASSATDAHPDVLTIRHWRELSALLETLS